MIEYGHGIAGYALTFLCLIFALFTSILSSIVILMTLYHLHRHRRQLKRQEKITFVLSSHIYLFIFIFMITLISMNIQTLIGDVYGNNFESLWCIFRGYWLCVSASVMYYGFVVQAIYRLFRIVYSNHRWLQSYWIFVSSPLLLFIIASVLLSPLLIWHYFAYITKEHYCLVPSTNIQGMVWMMFVCYLIPLGSLHIIHFRITIFLRQQPPNLAISIKEKQQRDLAVIRRIFINIGVVMITGLPAMVLVLMAMFSGVEYALGHRITYATVGLSFAVLSIEMLIMTPQLKRLILKRWQQNRVTTTDGMLPMRTIGSAT